MIFNRETIEATKQAVEKWTRISRGDGVDVNCSLCSMFGYRLKFETEIEGCYGCPIYEFAGADCMNLAVYTCWRAYYYDSHRYCKGIYPHVFDPKSRQLAWDMIEFVTMIFIKTLLLWDLKEDWKEKEEQK